MSHFAQLSSFKIHYQVEGSGFPILFIHGFTEDLEFWAPQVNAFKQQFLVVSFDLRGFGKSDSQPDHDFTYFDDIKEFLDYLKIAKAHIVGHSLGGSIAINFAIKYPTMVQSLTVSASVLGGYDWKDRSVLNQIWGIGKSDIEAAKEIWKSTYFTRVLEQQKHAAYIERMLANYSGWHWQNLDRSKPLEVPARQQLNKIKIPTKIFVGNEDLSDGLEIARILHKEIAGSEINYFNGVGHIISLEAEREFNNLLLEFLKRNSP